MTSPHPPAGSSADGPGRGDEEGNAPIIRDKRRLDPTTGAIRTPAAGATGQEGSMADQDHDVMADGDDSFAGAVGDQLPGGYSGRHAKADSAAARQAAAAAAAYGSAPSGRPAASAPTPDSGSAASSAPAPDSGPAAAAQGAPDVPPQPAASAGAGHSAGAGRPESDLAAERLADLQRLQAEYVNYKRRVDRDRELQRDVVVAGVIESLVPVLDDIHFARQHGELVDGPFARIAEKLEGVLSKYGVERYGQPGETFDPTVHEAVMHIEAELAPGTTETTVVQVMQPGYRLGDRLIRAAMVSVADPQ